MWSAPLAGGADQDPPLVAVAHGSRDPRAAAVVEALLDEVRRARPGLPVRTAYLDHAAPSLGQALAGLGEAVVLPLLLTEAYHSRVDLPAAPCQTFIAAAVSASSHVHTRRRAVGRSASSALCVSQARY
ncbi:CbiX/SirB N-terminal domain-containing protein, partial [Nonomuraea sp. 3-1Str]|uniref:CbiX/SirB N-terminal domain-containing protein n=1 Tax=Nonomuraea sp. 3-1Str TaxID=2929801 RepID=UPI00285E2B96